MKISLRKEIGSSPLKRARIETGIETVISILTPDALILAPHYNPSSMRIAIDIRNIGKKRTGDETVFLNLVKELAKVDDVNEYFLCIDTRSEEKLATVRSILGIEKKDNFHIYPLGSGNKFYWNAWTLPNFVRRMNIDVYHTQYIVPVWMPRRTKIVTHIHDVSFRAHPEVISWKDKFFLYILIPFSLSCADALIAVSEFTAQEIDKWYGKKARKKTRVVRNGITRQNTASEPTDDRQKELQEKYILPKRYFLYIGTLQPRKNIPFLLRAFDDMADKKEDIALVVGGSLQAHNADPKIGKAFEKMRHKDRVVFPGYIDGTDLLDVYRMAVAVVLPSKYEGFGLPVGEAIELGVPVLASDIPPHREVGGKYARYFSLDNLAELSRMLYDFSTSPQHRAPSQEATRSLPRWKEVAVEMLRIYKSFE